jgi:hypothetical protein
MASANSKTGAFGMAGEICVLSVWQPATLLRWALCNQHLVAAAAAADAAAAAANAEAIIVFS